MASKDDLRTRYRRERAERYLPHTFEILLDIPEIINAEVVASYYSYGFEPDTTYLNQALIAAGKTVLLPRTNDREIEWADWDGKTDSLKAKKKFLEPTTPTFTDINAIQVVITPALRIDREGYRLGQGGGFYDRALPALNAFTIGLIHPDEIEGQLLPRDEWDIPLNAAATPDIFLRFR